MQNWNDIIAYYRDQGAPQDQQMLIAMVREVQEACGGTLTAQALAHIAQAIGWKESTLCALIRRVPSIRMADAPNRLEMCGTCKKGAELRAYIEAKWGVKNGQSCPAGGFSYHVVPCMKNCANGPSVRWNGQLYSRVTAGKLDELIGR